MPPAISARARSMVRMTMADMAELADRRPGAFRLENADSDLAPPAHAVKATIEAVGRDRYNSYLPLHGLPELREAIANRYRDDLGLRYDPDGEIVVTAGIGEAMLDVLLSYVNDGDRVLMSNPTYNGMAQRVRLAGGTQVFTNQTEADGWHLDRADLRRAARDCKVIFYGSPAMPTGVIFRRDDYRTGKGSWLSNRSARRRLFLHRQHQRARRLGRRLLPATPRLIGRGDYADERLGCRRFRGQPRPIHLYQRARGSLGPGCRAHRAVRQAKLRRQIKPDWASIRLRTAVWSCGRKRRTLRLRPRPVRKPVDDGNDIDGLPKPGPARTRLVRCEGLPGNGWTGRR